MLYDVGRVMMPAGPGACWCSALKEVGYNSAEYFEGSVAETWFLCVWEELAQGRGA